MSDISQQPFGHAPSSFSEQFEGISGLRQWFSWLWAMFTVCLILGAAYFTPFPAGGIYVVIVGLFAATMWKSYHDIRFLDRETKLASLQVSMLEELNDIAGFVAKADKSVFRSHIESLYTIFLAHPEIKQDNLIEVLHSRLMARNRVVELFASILITLGLIGTILGLIETIGGLGVVLQGSSNGTGGDLAKKMMGALGGLDVAFYTTLLGSIFGGVVLRILTSVVDANIMKYTAHIAELTEVNVLPVMRRIASKLESAGYYRSLDEGGTGS